MEIIVKVYESYWSNFERFNFITKEKITIEQNLDTFDIATFKVNWYDIVEYNKIEIYEIWYPDVLVFKWIVYQTQKSITVDKNDTIITCRSERFLMNKRQVLSPRNKNDTVQNIITELLNDYSADNFTMAIWFNNTIAINYDYWHSYETLLDDICLQCGWFWDINNWVLRLDYLLGQDKTSGSNKTDIIFSKSLWDNVKHIQIIWQTTRVNIVVWDDWTNKHISQDLSDWVIYWVEKIRFVPWDLIAKTDKKLEQLNIRQRILNIELDTNKNLDVNIWDKLNLDISNVDDLEDIKSEVLVTKKKITYDYWEKLVEINVWQNIIKEDWLWDIIVSIKKELDMIK